jgi:uncharacterized protein
MIDIQTTTHEVLWAFFLVSLLLGAISQRTHFCTLGALSDIVHMEDWTRARQWLLASATAMLGFAYLCDISAIKPKHSMPATD